MKEKKTLKSLGDCPKCGKPMAKLLNGKMLCIPCIAKERTKK